MRIGNRQRYHPRFYQQIACILASLQLRLMLPQAEAHSRYSTIRGFVLSILIISWPLPLGFVNPIIDFVGLSYHSRACPSNFVIPLVKYRKAVYGTRISVGMRFGMMFETEESGKRR